MIVLGISAFGQNPAACLLVDGKLIAFAEEERFVRIKSAFGRFPSGALRYCLFEAGLKLGDIDTLAVGWDAIKYRSFMPFFFLRNAWDYRKFAKSSSFSLGLQQLLEQQPAVVRQRISFFLREFTGNTLPQVEFVPHHLAHAASAYYVSGFNESVILVVDGSGEDRATTAYQGAGRRIIERWHIDIPHSLGWFYAAITSYLGFVPYQDDGHVMGLAAYGTYDEKVIGKLRRVLRLFSDGSYEVHPGFTLMGEHRRSEHYSEELVKLLGPPRVRGEEIQKRHQDIAFGAQRILEEAMLGLVKKATENGTRRNLCLAGGVALNCRANGMILRSGLVDTLFIQPASHDAGSALGAAMVVANASGDDPRFRMDHVRFGPSYSKNAIVKLLRDCHISFQEPKSIEETVAQVLVQGKVVAWFDGRMEVGPRALGGRSILADPRPSSIVKKINQVKGRELWRPLCPSILASHLGEYVEPPLGDARFMTVTYPVLAAKGSQIPAVVHLDGTTRPQAVSRSVDPSYFRVIQAFYKRTGVSMVLNTSFNVRGEPIVCSPQDAIRSFSSSSVDALAIEGLWLEKNDE